MSFSPYTFKSTGTSTRPERMKPPQQPPPEPTETETPSLTRSRSSSLSSITSFTSAVSTHDRDAQITSASTTTTKDEPSQPPLPRFPPAEEAEMLTTSNTLKLAANKQFAGKDYSSAISTYDKAIAELPIYLDYELAVLQSNISACHIGLKEWKDAIESAEKGLDCLERELPTAKPKSKSKSTSKPEDKSTSTNGTKDTTQPTDPDSTDQIIELPDDTTEEDTATLLATLNLSDARRQDILRIRSKLLLRRARSNVMLCDQPQPQRSPSNTTSHKDDDDEEPFNPNDPVYKKPSTRTSPFSKKSTDPPSHWSHLSSALTDYTTLSAAPYLSLLPASDRKTVFEMLRTLPPRVEVAKKREVDEMMGKLKELGNGILKPFGLSTDMFKMTQDPSTGGWSMGFDGKAGKK